MTKSKNLGLNLPSRDNTTDLADINIISENFKTIDNEFEIVYDKLNNTGVVNTVRGNPIVLKDSAKAPLQNLKLYGKTEQDGTPTPDNPIELKSVGDSGSFMVGVYGDRNLLEVNNTTQTLNGVTFTNNGDGSVTISGTASKDTYYDLSSSKNIKLPKGRYKMIGNNWSAYLNLDGAVKGSYYYPTKANIEISSGNYTLYPHIWVAGNSTVNFTCKPMLLLEDETDTTFVKGETSQTLTMPYTLRSVPNATNSGDALGVGETTDIVDLNKAIKTENILKVTLDGTESIREHANGMLYVNLYGEKTKYKKFRAGCGLCDQLTNCFGVSTGNVFHIGVEGVYIGKNDSFSTVDELKAHLTTNPMTFYITLQTPIETLISETELNAYRQLMTNKGNTTILSEADMEISYVADTKLYIDNKIAELTALTLEV